MGRSRLESLGNLYGCIIYDMYLGGGNSNIFDEITPKIGEDEPILTIFVQMGRNHQPGIYFSLQT